MRGLAVACLLALLSTGLSTTQAAPVEARDYQAFWLWSGVRPQPVLAQAKTLYVLQGQVSESRHAQGQDQTQLFAQGIAIPRLNTAEVWLVYRAHSLRWNEDIYRSLLARLERWRAAGNKVVGIQIDFDARTRYLHQYASFLEDLRRRLPADCRLSITGLLDWGSQGSPEAINRLAQVVDELVVQTYQGRYSIPNYADYLPQVARLRLPFRIGLAQYAEWRAPDYLEQSPWFRGYVVFLQNPELGN